MPRSHASFFVLFFLLTWLLCNHIGKGKNAEHSGGQETDLKGYTLRSLLLIHLSIDWGLVSAQL